MKTLFLFFNADSTIRTGAIRVDGAKIPDIEVWEVWELYQTLIETGYKPMETRGTDGNLIHMIVY